MTNQLGSKAELKLSVKGIAGIAVTLAVLGGGAVFLTQQKIEVNNNAEGGSVENININSSQTGN